MPFLNWKWPYETRKSELKGGAQDSNGLKEVVFTFGLNLLTVGRDDDTLNLMQLHVLGDLSETHDQATFGFGLGRILLVDPLLEANQLLQQQSHALVDLLAQHLVTVPAEGETQMFKNILGYH